MGRIPIHACRSNGNLRGPGVKTLDRAPARKHFPPEFRGPADTLTRPGRLVCDPLPHRVGDPVACQIVEGVRLDRPSGRRASDCRTYATVIPQSSPKVLQNSGSQSELTVLRCPKLQLNSHLRASQAQPSPSVEVPLGELARSNYRGAFRRIVPCPAKQFLLCPKYRSPRGF